MDISPDGSELFVIQSPVRLLPGEYQVQPTRIAVYDTASGVGAEPIRTFEVPRRIGMLMLSNDGSKLYALSWDIYVLDPQTGEEIGRHPLRTWERENYSEPDVLDAWPQWEATDIFSSPYFAVRTDLDPERRRRLQDRPRDPGPRDRRVRDQGLRGHRGDHLLDRGQSGAPERGLRRLHHALQDRPRAGQAARADRARPHLLHDQRRLGRQRALRRRHHERHRGVRYRDLGAARQDRDAGRRATRCWRACA